jgi:RecG-like helicase
MKLKQRILTKISQKQKVFIVTPLIEESEKMEDLKSAIAEFENVKQLFP